MQNDVGDGHKSLLMWLRGFLKRLLTVARQQINNTVHGTQQARTWPTLSADLEKNKYNWRVQSSAKLWRGGIWMTGNEQLEVDYKVWFYSVRDISMHLQRCKVKEECSLESDSIYRIVYIKKNEASKLWEKSSYCLGFIKLRAMSAEYANQIPRPEQWMLLCRASFLRPHILYLFEP